MAVWAEHLITAKPWPPGHLLGNCVFFGVVLFQSEWRKSKSSPTQSALSTLCFAVTRAMLGFGAAFCYLRFPLNFLTRVVWLSLLLAALSYHPLTWGVLEWSCTALVLPKSKGKEMVTAACQLTAPRSSHGQLDARGYYKTSFYTG